MRAVTASAASNRISIPGWSCGPSRNDGDRTQGNLLISLALSACKSEVKSKPPRRKPPRRNGFRQKSEFVDIKGEDGDQVEPPPPEVVEPDPELSPEEAEQARKDYLLTRFWISARGFWGSNGDRLAWLFTIGLVDPDRRQCRLSIRHQCLESRDLRRHREARFAPPSSISPRCSSRSRSAACCSAWRRCSRAWASSAAGAPG